MSRRRAAAQAAVLVEVADGAARVAVEDEARLPVAVAEDFNERAARPPFTALGLGLLKDGRHVAFEAEVGREVRGWTALCALAQAEGPARAWWQVGFATLCAKRALLPAEVEANARDGHGVSASDFVEGAAVAIVGEGRTLTALAMRLEGTTVAEPAIIARGSREYCWSELAAWAALNMLPKRRRM